MIKINTVPGHLEYPIYRVKLKIRNKHNHDKIIFSTNKGDREVACSEGERKPETCGFMEAEIRTCFQENGGIHWKSGSDVCP